MSTKKIRELIEDAGNWDDSRRYELTQAALAEVEAIEKAARDIEAWQTAPVLSSTDTVRLTKAAGHAFEVLESIAKESM